MKIRLCFLIGLFIIATSGCEKVNNTENNQKKEAVTKVTDNENDRETLSKLISLPYEPLEIHWKLVKSHQESQSLLVGLRLPKEAYEDILAKSEPLSGKDTALFPSSQFELWVSEETREQLKLEHTSGLVIFLNIAPRKPDIFTQALSSPFIHGELIGFADEYILLSLYSM